MFGLSTWENWKVLRTLWERLRTHSGLAILAMAVTVPAWGQSYVTGPDTGPEAKLDNTPSNVTFNLTVTGSGTYSLAGGIFFMKAGTDSTATVTLTVYDSVPSAVGSVTLSNAQFCAGVSQCQSYAYHTFTFASALGLSPGSYTLVLSTAASPQQNEAYFVKGGGANFSVAASPGPPSTSPDLAVTKSSSPESFVLGNGAVYSIQVVNVGDTASSGTVTVTDTLDSNLTYLGAAGSGWTCGAVGQVVTCTSSAAISPGASAPALTVSVQVKENGETSVTNGVTVAGGGESNTSNDSFQLVSSVSAVPPATPVPPTIWLTLVGWASVGLFLAARKKSARAA